MRVTRMVSGVFAGQLISAAIQAISMVLLARNTNPAAFGRAVAIITAASVLMAVVDIGLGTLAVKIAAREPQSPELSIIFKVTLASSLLLCIVVCIGIFALGQMHPSYYYFAPLAVWMIAEKQVSIRSAVLVASGMVAASTRSLILSRIVSLVAFYGMLALRFPPTLSYALGYTIGAITGLALLRLAMLSKKLAPSGSDPIRLLPALSRPMIRRSAPFFVATLSYQVRTLDVTSVSLIAGPAAAGIYAVPARLSAPLRLLPTVLNSLTMPIVAGGSSDMLEQLKRIIRLTWVALILFLAGLAVFAEQIIANVVGEAYREAATPLRILSVGIAINIIGASKSAMLQASGDEAFVARMGIAIGVVSLAAVACGAHWGGAVGAAIGMAVTYILQFVVVTSRRVHRVGSRV